MILAFAVTTVAGPASARGPSKKQLDEAMMRLPSTDVVRVTEAEDSLRVAADVLEGANADLGVARMDERAAKAWVDASNLVLKAIALDRKAAEEAARVADLDRLSTQQVRSEASLKWRMARLDGARDRIVYLQAKIGWAKARLDRLLSALKEAKLVTWKASVEDTPDIDLEIAKASESTAKADGTAAKARGKMEKAELAWQSAVATANALAP